MSEQEAAKDLIRTLSGAARNLDKRQLRSAATAARDAEALITRLTAELDAANDFIDRNLPAAPEPESPSEAVDRAENAPRDEGYEQLTFGEFMRQNRARSVAWHGDGEPWNGADWSNAMCGEAGEAANVVKKLRRIETGVIMQNTDENQLSEAYMRADLAHELADVLMYLDLVAWYYKIDLPRALVNKFNLTSDKYGFPQRITTYDD